MTTTTNTEALRTAHMMCSPGYDGSHSAHCSCGWSSYGHATPTGAWRAEQAHRKQVGVA